MTCHHPPHEREWVVGGSPSVEYTEFPDGMMMATISNNIWWRCQRCAYRLKESDDA